MNAIINNINNFPLNPDNNRSDYCSGTEYYINAVQRLVKRLHENQTRDDGGDYYLNHILRVGMMVRDIIGDWGLDEYSKRIFISTAFLHDTLEDTEYTEKEMRLDFGDEITDCVLSLTNRKNETDEEYVKRMSQLNEVAALVKLCDRYCNLLDSLQSEKWGYNRTKRYAIVGKIIDENTHHWWRNINSKNLDKFLFLYRKICDLLSGHRETTGI